MAADPGTLAALAYGAVVIAGAVQGARGRITVFQDLGDLVMTFAIIGGAVAAVYVAVDRAGDDRVLASRLVGAILVLAVAAIGWRCWRQNRSPGAAALALATKLPFAAAVPLLVLQAAAPTGNTAARRASKRASALLLLTVLAPLMLALVRDKDGMRRYLGVA